MAGLWSLPTTFAALNGNQPASLLDNDFNALAQSSQYATSVSGTNTIVIATTMTFGAYVAGMRFGFVAANTNTGATTFNAGVGAAAVLKNGTMALVGGEIVAGAYYEVYFDGTQFQLLTQTQSPVTMNVNTGGGVAFYAHQMDFTTYNTHEIRLDNLRPTGNGIDLWLRFAQAGVPDTTNVYDYVRWGWDTSPSSGIVSGVTQSKLLLASNVKSNASGAVGGWITIRNVNGNNVRAEWQVSWGGTVFALAGTNGSGDILPAAARTQAYIVWSDGLNFQSGTSTMYGYRK